MVQTATVYDLFDNPQHPYTRALLAASPVPDPSISRERILLPDNPPTPLNMPSGCRFRTDCPIAQDVCAAEAPPLVAVGAGHLVECHFPSQFSGSS